eukprot:SAG31_NODE_7030_length_1811_cov_1.239486_2_plen_142_part_00
MRRCENNVHRLRCVDIISLSGCSAVARAAGGCAASSGGGTVVFVQVDRICTAERLLQLGEWIGYHQWSRRLAAEFMGIAALLQLHVESADPVSERLELRFLINVDTFSISAMHLAIKVRYFSNSWHANEKVTALTWYTTLK